LWVRKICKQRERKMGKADGKKNREYPLNIMCDKMRIHQAHGIYSVYSTVFYKLAE
jgi:hypothetical protein